EGRFAAAGVGGGAVTGDPRSSPRAPAAGGGTLRLARRAWSEDREPGAAPPPTPAPSPILPRGDSLRRRAAGVPRRRPPQVRARLRLAGGRRGSRGARDRRRGRRRGAPAARPHRHRVLPSPTLAGPARPR